MRYQQFVDDGLKYLAKQQNSDGSFFGQVSARSNDFSKAKPQPSSFYTSLISACIKDAEAAKLMLQKAAKYILSQRSQNWSWNYWHRTAAIAKKQPYPDDLDDTACALIALHHTIPQVLNGSALAHFANQLIATETAAGGPYKTWLVDTTDAPVWDDVDVAVNANIACFLALQGALPTKLETYITEAILTDKLQSTYYISDVPTIYFISRWYHGPASDKLRRKIIDNLQHAQGQPLAIALLISSGCNLGISIELLQTAANQLISLRENDHWQGAAFYGEPAVDGVAQYAGSPNLTTAFAIEALSLVGRNNPVTNKATNTVFTRAAKEASHIQGAELQTQLRLGLKRLRAMDRDQQISRVADLTAQAYEISVSPRVKNSLNVASLYGWLAYTIYDDFLDGDGQPAQLSAAHIAQRRMLWHFNQAIPSHDFSDLVSQTLEQVDAANAWEVMQTRAQIKNHKLLLKRLPDYANLGQLAKRSWGHSLAPIGCLLAVSETAQTIDLQSFLHHYLIARQLNDDAHDWEEDISRGHISAVVTQLLKDYGNVLTLMLNQTTLEELRLTFWQTTIIGIAEQIKYHANEAQKHLVSCPNPTIYKKWLTVLTGAAQKAIDERAKTLEFIQTF